MIYQVMLSENQSVLIENVDHVQYDEDTVLFRQENGNFIAAFKMYNIVGFFRMDVPAATKEYKWDFDLIDEYTRKQNEEAAKNASIDENISGKIYGIDYGYLEYPEKGRLAIKVREEAERKAKGWTDTYAAVMKEAEHQYNHREVHFKEIHDVSVEVMEEAINRGGMIVTGGVIPLLARNSLKELLKYETDNYEIDHLEKLLKRNMNDCLGVTT